MPATISISVESNLPEVGARLIAADRAFPMLTREKLAHLPARIAPQAVTFIKDATPVGVSANHLRNTTESDTTSEGEGFRIDVRQTKTVGSWVLAPLLILGHRVVAKGGRDTGKVVGPNDYVSGALDPLIAELDGQLVATGDEILGSVVAILK